MTSFNTLDQALNVASMGAPVFPCHPELKFPLCEGGFKDATTDPEGVRALWAAAAARGHENAMIGVPTGVLFDVIDIDRDKKTGELPGLDVIREQYPEVLEAATVQVTTRTGGLHLWFAPGTPGFKNWVGRAKKGKADPLPGIDVRVEGGYVIVPPTDRYDFTEGDWTSTWDLAPVPESFREAMIDARSKSADGALVVTEAPSRQATAKEIEHYRPMAERALYSEAAQLSEVLEGGRNHALNTAAFNMGQLIGAGVIEEDVVYRNLFDAALGIGLEEEEIRKTLRSGLEGGKAKPRDIAKALEGTGSDLVGEFLQRYVYIEEADRVGDLKRPADARLLRIQEFRNSTAMHFVDVEVPAPIKSDPERTVMKPKPVCEIWLRSRERMTAEGEIYTPGADRMVGDREGRMWWNTYHGPDWSGAEGPAPDLWLQLVETVIPDPKDRVLFERFVAHTIYKPLRRPSIVPLVVTKEHGMGKGLLVRGITRLLGPENVSNPKMAALLKSEFNEYLYQKTLAVVDEVADLTDPRQRFRAMDHLRDIMTEPRLRINRKGLPARTFPIYTNFLLLSNHDDALVIDEKDRRLFVSIADGKPRDQAFYTAVADMLDDPEQLARIAAHYRPLADDELPERAPMNASKRRMIEVSTPEWADDLRTKLEGETRTFTWDAIVENVPQGIAARAIAKHLDGLGWQCRRVYAKGKKRKLWSPCGKECDRENFIDVEDFS
ncbi:MAG: bifunctional DNA primase/polymerase [Pseudomonadota bacterium]